MHGIVVALLVLCLVPSVVAAAQTEPVTLYTAFRWHEWREQYTEQATGNPESLKEQGPLLGVGILVPVSLLSRPTAGGELMLRNGLEVFGGQVRYHGHLQNIQTGTLTPYETDVNYFGIQGLMDLGWRFPVNSVTIEPFAGLGVRWWLRNLQGGGGYNEYWLTLNNRFGGRFTWPLANSLTVTASGGAQLPFYTTNDADGTTLEPDGQWSGFGELSLVYGRWEHAVTYEGLRYRRSPTEFTGQYIQTGHGASPLFASQPPSQSDIFGYRLGYRF
jgi:hypothetical protein